MCVLNITGAKGFACKFDVSLFQPTPPANLDLLNLGPHGELPPGVDERNVIRTGDIAIFIDTQAPTSSDPASLGPFGQAIITPAITAPTTEQLFMSKVHLQ